MTTYSVADAKTGLPGLIDRALEGEGVVITRHGKPVAELKPIAPVHARADPASYDWLRKRRQARKGVGLTSVDILNSYDTRTRERLS